MSLNFRPAHHHLEFMAPLSACRATELVQFVAAHANGTIVDLGCDCRGCCYSDGSHCGAPEAAIVAAAGLLVLAGALSVQSIHQLGGENGIQIDIRRFGPNTFWHQ
ncbi:MAG: hypothetical protein GFH27_549291n318 [Chloroflexi bacterium AL-W]|nr:hypothetical protein [Chloroflexi bacterium AL-N1]NOK67214.1 hypothetical protein [Chloroflexi bacterium AL-N10]NOK75292.1 hypothetical protein [Chloroflexi bacterium AL-N5]NOK82080.1 hypothetical protein [Chloroflexi bacterium AL-W]NOK89925.1 hypothetical protein [Chloroflexi bacterium AL-N15]